MHRPARHKALLSGWTWLLLSALAFSSTAAAHVRSESFSQWRYEAGRLEFRFTVNTREASRIADGKFSASPAQMLVEYLAARVKLDDARQLCSPIEALRQLPAQPGYLRAEAVWRCDGLPAGIRLDAFFDLAAEHTHFAALRSADRNEQRLMTAESRIWQWTEGSVANDSVITDRTATRSGSSNFVDYVFLGAEHIFGGLDHMVFLLALLLVCRRFSDLVWAISGFTLGHSLTLALAVMQVVDPRIIAIEAVIGLSIALPALERGLLGVESSTTWKTTLAALALTLLPFIAVAGGQMGGWLLSGIALFSACYLLAAHSLQGSGLYRISITALFGLVHGFGFAGAFTASQSGIEIQPWMLAGFNIGVEIGQLLFVSGLLLLALPLHRWLGKTRLPADLLAAAVFGMGLFWFYSRGL